MSDEAENIKIGKRLTGGLIDFAGHSDAALGVDKGAVFLPPSAGGQDEVGAILVSISARDIWSLAVASAQLRPGCMVS